MRLGRGKPRCSCGDGRQTPTATVRRGLRRATQGVTFRKARRALPATPRKHDRNTLRSFA
ncbi:hypothetical protein ACFPRL_20140 [Pseudoclavibacter helvolus]